MTDPINDAVEVLLGMAYETRLRIMMMLVDGDRTPSDLAAALALDATLVAHHLRHLLTARLVRRKRRGRHVFYGIDGAAARLVAEIIRYVRPGP